MKNISNFIGVFILILILGCGGERGDKNNEGSLVDQDSINTRLKELTQVIESNKNNDISYFNRANYYLEIEEYNNAFKDIWTALEIDSTVSDYYVTLADSYIGMGKLQAGIEALEEAVVRNDENIKAYIKLAEISIVFRDYKNALNYVDKALKIDELESKGYFLRGVVLLENGDTVKSIRNFQKAVDYNQNYFEANLQLGIIFSEKKNDLAIDYLNNALNINPDHIEVIYYLSMYYQNTERYKKAIQMYNLLLVKDPEYNIGYINLVYLEKFEEAINYFTQTIEINPDYADAYYNRGFAYELLKDVEKSRTDYQKTLELNTNYEKALDGLNRIDDFLINQ